MKKFMVMIIVVVGVIGFMNIKTAYKEQTVTKDDIVEFYRTNELESRYDELVVYEESDGMIRCYTYIDGERVGTCSFNRTFYENQYNRK